MSPLTELNCNVALQLVFKAHRLHAGDGFHHRRFAVRHMTDGANVDGRLPRDHLRGEGCKFADFLQRSQVNRVTTQFGAGKDVALPPLSLPRKRVASDA